MKNLKFISFLIIFLSLIKVCCSQTTIYTQNFGVSPISGFPSGWSETGGTTGWYMSSSSVSTGYTGASGGINVRAGSQTTADTLNFSRVSTTGYSNITIIWGERKSSATAPTPVLQWSSDSITWNPVSFTDVTGNSTWALVNAGTRISLPAGAAGVAHLRFRWIVTAPVGSGNIRIDDFSVQGNVVSSLPASKISIVSVNGGLNPDSCHSFNVIVQTLDANDVPANVTSASTVNLTKLTGNGTGSLSGGTGTIASGQNSTTITVTYPSVETGISLLATCVSLTSDTSDIFNVNPCIALLPSCYSWDTLHGVTLPYPFGWYAYNLGTPNAFGHTAPNSGNFNVQGDSLVVHFNVNPGAFNFYLATYNLLGTGYIFDVYQSPNGLNYSSVNSFTSGLSAYPIWTSYTYVLSATSRFVKFVYTTKPTGGGTNAIAIDEVCIALENSNAATSANASPPSICTGSSSTLNLAGGSLAPGANWDWYTVSCGGAYQVSGTNPSVNPSSTTTYFARAEGPANTTTCVSVTVSVNDINPSSVAAAPTSICAGVSATLSLNGGTLVSGSAWYWYSDNCGGTFIGTGVSIIETPVVQTIYFVRAEGTCDTTSCLSVTVSMGTVPVPSSLTATPDSICQGATSSLNAISSGNSIAWWNAPSGGTIIGTSLSGNNFTVSPSTSTTYYAEAGLYTYYIQTYTYTGSQQSFTVPSGLTSVGVDAYGAQGGFYDTTYGKGGLGGRIQTTLTVSPGQTLYIYVGGQGTSLASGWNGGGCGTGCLSTTGYYGGGGGGATDIRSGSTSLTNRIIVAGGGGGGAYYTTYTHSNGGAGGDTLAANGYRNNLYNAAYCGAGGSQTAGGAAASSTTYPGATAGSSGVGGSSAAGGANGGGGGGGGYYGGGAGISTGAGGGGSSYASAIVTSNTIHTPGFQPGNGQLMISWYTYACQSSRVPVNIFVKAISTLPSLLSSSSTNVCPGNSVTISHTGGVPGEGANWNWYTGSCGGTYLLSGDTLTISQTITTEYWLRAEGTCNTTTCLSINITLNTNSNPATLATGTSPVCPGTTTTLGVTGGLLGTGARWEWYTASCGGTYITSGAAPHLNPSVSSLYYVRAEGTCNTTTCLSVTIVVNTASVAGNSINSIPDTICYGASAVLSISGGTTGTGASWYWYTGSCGGNAAGTGITINTFPSITEGYYVRAQGTCNTTVCTSIRVNVISIPSDPQTAYVTPDTIPPGGQSTFIYVTGNLNPGDVWVWYENDCGLSSPIGTSSGIEEFPTASTVYYVRVENGTCYSNCLTASLIVLTSLNDAGIINISPSDSICYGDTCYMAVTGNPDGGQWYWYYNYCGGVLAWTGPLLSATPDSTTIYTVRQEFGTLFSTCDTEIIYVNTLPAPATSVTFSKDTICQGDSILLGISGGTTGSSAIWYWYSDSCGGTFEGNGSNLTVHPNLTTDYYVRAEGICNTTSCTDLIITVLDSSMSAGSLMAYPDTICSGFTATLSVTGGSLGANAMWSWYAGSCGSNFAGTGASIVISPVMTTTYFVRAEGVCSTTACMNILITVNDSSVSADMIILSSDTICAGNSATLVVSGGAEGSGAGWSWYSGSCGGTFEGTGDTLVVFPTSATDYFVRAEGICNTTNCSDKSLVIITIPQEADTISGITNPAAGDTDVYHVTSIAGLTYSWTAPSGWVGTSNSNSISYFVGSDQGNVSVVASNACGASPVRTLFVMTGHTINGYFNYDNTTLTPLDSVWVHLVLNGNIIDSVQTVSDGFYRFLNVPDGDYNITGTTNKPWEYVNATDLELILNYTVGALPYPNSSIRIHAADVNQNYGINSLDAVQIEQRISGIRSSFNRGDWIFEKPTGGDTISVSPYLNDTVVVNNSDITQDFLGRCTGDVNYNTFSDSAGVTTIASDTACPGTIISIPVTISNSPAISAITLRMEYDGSVLSFISCTFDSSSLFGSPGSIPGIQKPWNNNMKTLTLLKTLGSSTLSGSGKLFDLNFMYYGGTTAIVFDNSSMEGLWCEYADIFINPLNDKPTNNYYINGNINERITTPSNAATYISASKVTVCQGSADTLQAIGGTLGLGASWNWYEGSCGGYRIGTGDTIISMINNPLLYVRAESQCNTTACTSITLNPATVPSQPDSISGSTNPVAGLIEQYYIDKDTNVTTYLWTAPSGWTGTSSSSSVSFIAGNSAGTISVVPLNACGSGPARTLFVNSAYSISGDFLYNNLNSTPLDSVWVFLMQDSTIIDSVLTDTNGYYKFQNINNGKFQITATTNKLWSGVNSTDAVKVKRHFAGSELFTSSIRLHSADVNLSYGINATDAVKITRRFVGSDTSFPRGDWDFEKPLGGDTINVSATLNDTVVVYNANVTQDFYGLCVGDVNGSNVPSTKSSPKISLEFKGFIKLNNNDLFQLPIKTGTSLNIGAISMILTYPKDLVKITGLQVLTGNGQDAGHDNLFYNIIGNKIRIGWFEEDRALNVNNNEPVLIITGRTYDSFKADDIVRLDLVNDPLCEIADESGTPLNNIVFSVPEIIHSDRSIGKDYYQFPANDIIVFPNPAGDLVNIEYNVPMDGLLKMSLFNFLGDKVMDIFNDDVKKGIFQTVVNVSDLQPGVYTFRMVLDNNIMVVKKLVIYR